MKIKDKELTFAEFIKSTLCIGIATAIGLFLYWFCYVYHIAILGFNLAIIFAPIISGLIETVMANKILGRNLGAISAFILFIDITIHSFILRNPSLGLNFITAGTLVLILQAAFPTALNYIIMVITGATISNFKWIRKEIKRLLKKFNPDKVQVYEIEEKFFDEKESNDKLNSLDFFFITSTDMPDKKFDIIRIFQSQVILDNIIPIDIKQYDLIENNRLMAIKEGKDECLIRLANKIKENGGNGILDLDIKYGAVGLSETHLHITATGMGIFIK